MLLTYPKAAEKAGRTVRSVQNWAAAGMPVVRFEGHVFVDDRVLFEWKRRRNARNAATPYRQMAAGFIPDTRNQKRLMRSACRRGQSCVTPLS